jgi:hypothetical protein
LCWGEVTASPLHFLWGKPVEFDFGVTCGQARPNVGKSKDISIIIPHRGNTLGVWATIHACEVELEGSPYSYEYVLCVNGEPLDEDLKIITNKLALQNKLGDLLHSLRPLSPPSARQLASESAVGEYLFFFDNHCIPSRGYFDRAIKQMVERDMDCLHSTTQYYVGECHYHYKLTLEADFWVDSLMVAKDYEDPYRIAMAGHGGFVIKRSLFNEIGGYGPLEMFQGWAGEESYFELKLGLLGKSNWLDPKLKHFHFSTEKRGYSKTNSDDYYRNLMVAANVIGGKAWLDRVYKNFQEAPKQPTGVTIGELYQSAEERSRSHAEWLASKRLYTLDELLEKFNNDGTAH